jgi:hypothetical protein
MMKVLEATMQPLYCSDGHSNEGNQQAPMSTMHCGTEAFAEHSLHQRKQVMKYIHASILLIVLHM